MPAPWPFRFFLDAALAALTAGFALLTLLDPRWIEAVTGLDPDHGSGSLEWGLVGVLAAMFVLLSLAARAELRRVRATAPATN